MGIVGTERDDEMWLAMHQFCGPYGCGRCVIVDIEISDEDAELIRIGARLKGVPEDVYVIQAIVAGLQMELEDSDPASWDPIEGAARGDPHVPWQPAS